MSCLTLKSRSDDNTKLLVLVGVLRKSLNINAATSFLYDLTSWAERESSSSCSKAPCIDIHIWLNLTGLYCNQMYEFLHPT